MQLVTWNTINRRYFARKQGPTGDQWKEAILSGEVNGKIMLGKIYIDIDDFLSRDQFQAANDTEEPEIDLLS